MCTTKVSPTLATGSPVASISIPELSMATCPCGSVSTAKIAAGSAGMIRCTSMRSVVMSLWCHRDGIMNALAMRPVITCSDLTFTWPDGTAVLAGLNAVFGPGRTGLIGANGAGKSTLLRLIAGELRPTAGMVTTAGDVGYLRQDLALGTGATVADLLGIAAVRDALALIESGDASEQALAAVGDDWDVEDRARAELDRLGLAHLGLDSPVGLLSGGETMLLAVAALFLRRPEVILLDEPTNNLDVDARSRL